MFLRRLLPALSVSLFALSAAAQIVVPRPRPDLTIDSMKLSSPSIATSSGFDLTVNVKNVGTLPAAFVAFTVTFPATVLVNQVRADLSTLSGCTNILSGSDRVITCKGYPPVNGVDTAPLLPSMITSVGLSLTSPRTVADVVFTATADPRNVITDELSETNNSRTASLRVCKAPQVRVTIAAPTTPQLATVPFGMSVLVKNIGEVDATNVVVRIQIFSPQNFHVKPAGTLCDGGEETTTVWDHKCSAGTLNPEMAKTGAFSHSFAFMITPLIKVNGQIEVNAHADATNEDTPNDNTATATIPVTVNQ